MWFRKVCSSKCPREHEGERLAEGAESEYETEPESHRPGAEAADCPAGQATLHEDCQ